MSEMSADQCNDSPRVSRGVVPFDEAIGAAILRRAHDNRKMVDTIAGCGTSADRHRESRGRHHVQSSGIGSSALDLWDHRRADARPRTFGEGTAGRSSAPDDPAAAEEVREQRGMQRFLSLLEKNPRRGTALDRVYGYHVERGTLDAFIKSYRDRSAKDPKDGIAWLILGLLEFQRGQDAAAVAALRQAETNRPDDPLPAYYLGQALVLVGQPEQAADAFERALQRKPPRNDLMEIFQALGRVYQRTQKNEQALKVWGRLEALFPDDPRIQEQIAAALAEEDQPAQALPRFEALARKVADPFRQVQLAMQAAELKVRLGRGEEALKDFEGMLGKLRPDSWLLQGGATQDRGGLPPQRRLARPGHVLRKPDQEGARGRRGAGPAGSDARRHGPRG